MFPKNATSFCTNVSFCINASQYFALFATKYWKTIKPLMSGSNRSPYVLKQTCCFNLQVCLSTYDLLLLPDIKRLNYDTEVYIGPSQISMVELFTK